MLDGVPYLESQDARVTQAIPLNLSARAPHSAGEAFDPEKIVGRILRRQRGKKGAVSAAKIDFERRDATIDNRHIDRNKTIRRDELDLIVYGNRRLGGHCFK